MQKYRRAFFCGNDFDALAHQMIKERGATSCYIDYHPSFGAMPFGKVICTSVNDAVLHGLPHDYTLRDGDEITVDIFTEGEYIDVTGRSKGKGFQGVVKRHGFAGVGESSHGQHNRLRAPGSIGGASDPGRVFKGMRMAGQMGDARTTVENVQVLKVIPEQSLIIVKGAVPGGKGAFLILEKN